MNKKQLKEVAAVVLAGILTAVLLFAVSGCASVDFRKKALAAEIKVYGLDAEIPSTTSEESIARVRIGVVTTRYISIPKGGKGSIKMDYDGWNFWTLSGSATSEMAVENSAADTATDSGKE